MTHTTLNKQIVTVLMENSGVPTLHICQHYPTNFEVKVPSPSEDVSLHLMFIFEKDHITVFDSFACFDTLKLNYEDPDTSQKIKNLYEQLLQADLSL